MEGNMLDRSLPPLTILDLAYDILAWAQQPLPPEEIAATAREAGYDLDGAEIEAEIIAHITACGPGALFVEAGRSWYDLQWENLQPASAQVYSESTQPSIGLLVVVTLLCALLCLFVITRISPLMSLSPLADLAVQVAEQAEAAVQAEVALAPAPALEAPPISIGDSIELGWWQANGENQINESTQAVARQYLSNFYNTCGPAAVAMMINYHRAHQGAAGLVTTADVLRVGRTQLGFYTPPYNSGLLNFNHLRALAGQFGLSQSYPGENKAFLSLAELLERLREGEPAIAGMRYQYRRDNRYQPVGGRGYNGYDHFVIVFGIEQVDGQDFIWLLNPHPGKYLYSDQDVAPERYTLGEFMAAWGINDDSEYSNYGYAAFYQMTGE
jgi:hypothetical protein